MNPTYNFFIFLSVLCLGCVYAKRIPSYITRCHENDPELETCIRNAAEQIRPRMANGIPDLYIPPMNPLVLPEASLNSGDSFKATFKNIEIYYGDEFKIDHLKIDLDKVNIDLQVSFKRLRIKSQYAIDGRLLVLQLQGEGPADGNFTDVTAKLIANGKRYFKKGKEFIALTDKKLEFNIDKAVFRFDNLFKDNQELNDQTNRVINDNVKDIIDELKPVINQTVDEIVFGIIMRIFSRFSVDQLFPK